MQAPYAPDRGHIVLLDFSPQAGSEMAGEHRALVLSEARFSVATGLAVVCPITRQVKGSPFEVIIPAGLKAVGCVVASEIRTVDYLVRRLRFMEQAPTRLVQQVQAIACVTLGCR